MASHPKVLNLSRENSEVKRNQAVRMVEVEFTHEWVEKNHSIRALPRQERLARMFAASQEMPRVVDARHLQGAEVTGLMYQRPGSSTWQQAHLDAQNKFNGCLKAAREFSDCQCSWCSALAHRLAIREAALSCN